MTVEMIKKQLEAVLSPKRYIHSVNVMETAVSLAAKYGEDAGKAAVAGLLHDCARDVKADEAIRLCGVYGIKVDYISRMQPELLHGLLGEKLAGKLYGVNDPQVLRAIAIHTMGCPGMDLLGRIVLVADYIEPARTFPGADAMRKQAFENLDRAVLTALNSTIKYVIGKGGLLHTDTIETRNWILMELKKA
ncbi:MAG: HD domain-containing protein [Ruminiclostridium sp.]|nr:HD domain-containing protein [Ruminiclostridium sp.]